MALMEEIAATIEPNSWCTVEKAQALARIILETRPTTIVEIGVWQGGSLIPMLLALRMLGHGKAIAIDPWSPEASKTGEIPINAEWWGNVDHERAFQVFRERLNHHNVAAYCEIWRKRSDDCAPPTAIGLIHIDGNHTEQAFRDAQRFLPSVSPDGIAVLDDVDWTGGHVQRAVDFARTLGFRELRTLDKGVAMRRSAIGQ